MPCFSEMNTDESGGRHDPEVLGNMYLISMNII